MSKKGDNYLLAKTDLGQVKKGFHELPTQGHTYGKAPQKDKYGAREVISGWEEGTKSNAKQGGKNYIAMNRQGIKNGCIDSKQISEFRKDHEIKVKIKEGQKFYGVKIPEQQFTYGISNRPSTPIKNVICGTYATTQDQLQAQKEAVFKMLSSDKKKHPNVELSPKKAKIEANKKKEIEANNFKLSKFKNVQSKIKPLLKQNKA